MQARSWSGGAVAARRFIVPSLLAIAGAILVLPVPAGARDVLAACAASPRLVGPCRAVHARLTACTAVPSLRLWVVGSKRVLGVHDAKGNPAGDALPEWLDRRMFSGPPCMRTAWGDFTVCPLTPPKPGVMQRVCISAIGRITLKEEE